MSHERSSTPVEDVSQADFSLQESEGDWVYLIEANIEGLFKIGITSDLERRMKELRPSAVLMTIRTSRPRIVEKNLHEQYQHTRLAGTEYFRLLPHEVESITALLSLEEETIDEWERHVPRSKADGLRFSIGYQKLYTNWQNALYKKCAKEADGDLTSLESTELELVCTQCFDEFWIFKEALDNFKIVSYSGVREGVIAAAESISTFHDELLESGLEDENDGFGKDARRICKSLKLICQLLGNGCLELEVRQRVREAEAKDSAAEREWLRLEMEKLGITYTGVD
jgi:hypothetical protein